MSLVFLISPASVYPFSFCCVALLYVYFATRHSGNSKAPLQHGA